MNQRQSQRSVLLSPIVIGALTVAIAIVAVFLAFQADNSLPFAPHYSLHVQVRDAEELIRGSEVHEGGAFIGNVSSVTPGRDAAGQPVAVLNLALIKKVEPLPVDTHFTIRLKAAIGDKFLDVTLGHERRTWPNGATVPMSNTSADVDLDQFLSMFNAPTRAGIQASTDGFGNALAGRGPGLNAAIGAFVPLVDDLTPVMRNLAAPGTHLAGFFRGLETLSHALAPVADQEAQLYVNLDTTFRALASVAHPYLEQWIADTPPAFSTVIADSPREQAFATDTAALFADLRPGFATLPTSAPVLADAFAAGVRNLPGTASLDRQTVSLSRALHRESADSSVEAGLARLSLTASSLNEPLAFLTPAQSACNYVSLFLRNIGSTLSDRVGNGTVLRFVQIAIDDVTGGEAVPSQTPYLSTSTAGGSNHAPLHVDAYPNTDAPGETPECSAGNEPFSASSPQIGNPSGDVGLKTEATTAPGSAR